MSQLEVAFEVPQIIANGLATGQYQRIGGVIVETGSKQVVAWLREGGAINTVSQLTPDGLIGNALQMAVSMADGHLTRQSIHALGQTVQSMALLTTTGQVINVAITGATFMAVEKRFRALQTQLEAMHTTLIGRDNQNRMAEFTAALDMVRDALEMKDISQRHANAIQATQSLYRVKDKFLAELDELKSQNFQPEQLSYMQNLLTQAMLAHLTAVKCSLIRGEDVSARKRLKEENKKFEKYVDRLLQYWLEQHGAIYFHRDMSDDDMLRYLKIQKWRDDPDAVDLDAVFILNMISNVRGDFWNQDIQNNLTDQYSNIVERVTRRPDQTKADMLTAISSNLTQAEILIENFERLRGFELELRSVRLMIDDQRIEHLRTFGDWQQQITDNDLVEYEIGIILNRDRLG